jgi:hypothetical protein
MLWVAEGIVRRLRDTHAEGGGFGRDHVSGNVVRYEMSSEVGGEAEQRRPLLAIAFPGTLGCDLTLG